jgi:hypothetical protein
MIGSLAQSPAMVEPATTTVTFTVTEFERVRDAGRLIALAKVELEVAGVVLTMQGVRVLRHGRRLATEAPRFRDPATGSWVPALVIPDELGQAIARELLALLAHRC